jgi:hypothetical protein
MVPFLYSLLLLAVASWHLRNGGLKIKGQFFPHFSPMIKTAASVDIANQK